MMKIIIDIPKKVYDQICDQNLDGIMATAIRCGKPLLKDTLPSAEPEQPEIIRCKDCKQFRRWIDTNTCFCDITESEISDNDFCSRAERRRGGKDESGIQSL